ncbi:MAG: N-acetylmuramoyl-L-alanine amidase [Fimbriimonadaceae bacterium]|nr:N-acetylmuramoyl-L-alanine amidase [Fimbriimonadaceae bacterium]
MIDRCGRALAALAMLLVTTPRAAADEPSVVVLENLTTAQTTKGVTLRLDLSSGVTPTVTRLSEPDRLLFDFAGTRLKTGQTLHVPLNHPLAKSVRLGQFSDEPPIARLVLDLTGRHTYRLAPQAEGKILFIGLGEGGGKPAEPAPAQPRLTVNRTSWAGESDRAAAFVVELSELTAAKAFQMSAPARLVVDLDGARLAATAAAPGKDNGLVREVRAAQFSDDVVRLVFELTGPVAWQVLRRLSPSRLVIQLGRTETRGRKVVIDPGHGGKDPGCSGCRPGLREKDVVLDIGLRAAELLRGKGVEVQMTRSDDTFIPLEERPAIANRWGADLFVSIHCNAMPDDKKGQRSGTEVYYYTPQSEAFSEVMLQAFAAQAGLPARGTFQRKFVVVRYSQMPAVLVETGYLDHAGDGGKLDTPEFRQTCALGIVHGAMQFLQRLPGSLEPIETAAAGRRPEG